MVETGAPDALDLAVAHLGRGEAVALPTETVYGLAADATNASAVTAIYEAKGRPQFNPLICHMADLAMAEANARFSPLALRLAENFWPGPLTLVVDKRPDSPIHPLATAGLTTVGIRIPEGFARQVIAAFGRPLAAPSANRSGRISPTTAAHVARDLGHRIGLILDGGPCTVGLESTIIAIDGVQMTLLRPGGIDVDAIESAAGTRLLRHEGVPADQIIAPGMLASHYAPAARLRLRATDVRPGEAVLGFGGQALPGTEAAVKVLDLSVSGDLAEAAANLFSYLAEADATGAKTIAVAPIPNRGLGEAINDRLARAAAPRP